MGGRGREGEGGGVRQNHDPFFGIQNSFQYSNTLFWGYEYLVNFNISVRYFEGMNIWSVNLFGFLV